MLRTKEIFPCAILGTYHRFTSPALYKWYLVVTGSKVARHGFNNLPPFSIKVKERVELCLIYPCRPSWQVTGWTYLYPMYRSLCNHLFLQTAVFLDVTMTLWPQWQIRRAESSVAPLYQFLHLVLFVLFLYHLCYRPMYSLTYLYPVLTHYSLLNFKILT